VLQKDKIDEMRLNTLHRLSSFAVAYLLVRLEMSSLQNRLTSIPIKCDPLAPLVRGSNTF
jgi:hypothetical protein